MIQLLTFPNNVCEWDHSQDFTEEKGLGSFQGGEGSIDYKLTKREKSTPKLQIYPIVGLSAVLIGRVSSY